MVEIRNLHNGLEREEGVIGGVRMDLVLCRVRRRGSALDRSAAMMLMNKWKRYEDIYTHIWVVGHGNNIKLERVASREQERG